MFSTHPNPEKKEAQISLSNLYLSISDRDCNLKVVFFSRRLMSEDDVLSEVEPDTVPHEVRNWLSMTFTRSVTNMKKKPEEKPRFKSVAQAIRAGIMVDRLVCLSRLFLSLPSFLSFPFFYNIPQN